MMPPSPQSGSCPPLGHSDRDGGSGGGAGLACCCRAGRGRSRRRCWWGDAEAETSAFTQYRGRPLLYGVCNMVGLICERKGATGASRLMDGLIN